MVFISLANCLIGDRVLLMCLIFCRRTLYLNVPKGINLDYWSQVSVQARTLELLLCEHFGAHENFNGHWSTLRLQCSGAHFCWNHMFRHIMKTRLVICKTWGFTVVTMQNALFWDVTPCGSRGRHKTHTASLPRRRHSSYLLVVHLCAFEENWSKEKLCFFPNLGFLLTIEAWKWRRHTSPKLQLNLN
jgi:hypothetical protein